MNVFSRIRTAKKFIGKTHKSLIISIKIYIVFLRKNRSLQRTIIETKTKFVEDEFNLIKIKEKEEKTKANDI